MVVFYLIMILSVVMLVLISSFLHKDYKIFTFLHKDYKIFTFWDSFRFI